MLKMNIQKFDDYISITDSEFKTFQIALNFSREWCQVFIDNNNKKIGFIQRIHEKMNKIHVLRLILDILTKICQFKPFEMKK